MKICVAQTRPIRGDITTNVNGHKRWIELARSHSASIIIFPELSITGYEPELAAALATDKDDPRFDDFQNISDSKQITIAIGMPIRSDAGTLIGLIIFQPGEQRQLYCKQHLHPDEYPFFIPGKEQVFLTRDQNKMALSICYELSIPEHSKNAAGLGATIYIASVAKTKDGVKKAAETLSRIAKEYAMIALMANCVGHCDNFESAGHSAVWNRKGELLGQLDETKEGLLIFDTSSGELVAI